MEGFKMILGLQFIALAFALVMIYFAYVNFRKGEINRVEFASWLTAWVLAMIIVIFPDTIRKTAQTFSISRLLDLLIAGGFLLVMVMVSIAYIRTKRIEKKIEELVRKEALKEIKNKSK
jgi:hypothetical protein